MNPENQQIFDAALALPEATRFRLVESLFESLSPSTDQMEDDELLAELERRSADFDNGTAEPIPWSELKKED